MEKSNQVAAIIFGAAAALAIYKFYQMPKEERDELIAKLKNRTADLLENADETVEKVQHYLGQIQSKNPGEWFDKMYIARQMFNEFYPKNALKNS